MPTFLLLVALFWVYAMGPRRLPLVEAPLKPSFRYHVYDRLFLNYRYILNITPLLLFSFNCFWITGKSWKWNSCCCIHSQKQGAKLFGKGVGKFRHDLNNKNCYILSGVHQHNKMVKYAVLLPPLFWIFLVEQTLQNLLVVQLLNHVAWRNKLLMANAHIVTMSQIL
jgi:hypothetical protein